MSMRKRFAGAVIAGAILLMVGAVGGKVQAQLGSSTTTSTSTSSTATSTVASGKFNIGDQVFTTAAVKVRSTPDLTAASIGTLASGTAATVSGGPVQTGSSIFWNLTYSSAPNGWT